MLNKLIQFVFKIITKIFSIIFTPLFSGITVLFPSVGNFFNYISQFLGIALTYFVSVCRLVLLPQGALLLLFNYFAIKYSIFLVLQGVKFIMFIYEKLKP